MSPTTKQKAIIDSIASTDEGRFIIKACPGSGKTFTVAHLLLKELEGWTTPQTGIAVLSFTNKAGQEIEEKVSKIRVQKPRINHPHYVGTFDSFFNGEILFPFGKSSLDLPREPELVGEPYSTWKHRNFYIQKTFEALHYKTDGSFSDLDTFSVGIRQNAYNQNKGNIHNTKRRINASGLMTQSDATYFSYSILQKNKDLARMLAYRYPYIIIDEVQDSNEVSMAIINLLIDSGAKKVVLIGDPNQAIYEWNDAAPHLFRDKWQTWGDRFELDDSHRSSDVICDFVSSFSHGDEFTSAEECLSKNFPLKPFIRSCDLGSRATRSTEVAEQVSSIKEEFFDICRSNQIPIDANSTAVLCRSREDLPLIKHGLDRNEPRIDWSKCDKPQTSELCRAKFYYDMGDFRKAYKHWLNIQVLNSSDDSPSREVVREYVKNNAGARVLMGLCIKELTGKSNILDIDLASWVQQNHHAESATSHLVNVYAQDAFMKPESAYSGIEPTYSTVHGVKGATFDAVLLFLKSRGGSGVHYKTYIKDSRKHLGDNGHEDMRVVYVAISRPRKVLMVAVPSNAEQDWRDAFDGLLQD